MSHYRKIDCRIWNDEKFCSLSDNGKLVWIFLLTHPNLTPLGAMRASIPGLAAELQLKALPEGYAEAFPKAFGECLTKGMAKHDERASCVWIPNFLRYNRPESPNVVTSWVKFFDLIPECEIKYQCLLSVKAFLEDLPKAYSEGLPKGLLEGYAKDYLERSPNSEHRAQIGEHRNTTSSFGIPGNPKRGKVILGRKRKKVWTQQDFSEDARNLAAQLQSLILENNPAAKITDSQLVNWTREADLLLRVDHRDPQDALALLTWAQHDPFWRTNVLGMAKFRKQYDQLTLKAASNHSRTARSQLPYPNGNGAVCRTCGFLETHHKLKQAGASAVSNPGFATLCDSWTPA